MQKLSPAIVFSVFSVAAARWDGCAGGRLGARLASLVRLFALIRCGYSVFWSTPAGLAIATAQTNQTRIAQATGFTDCAGGCPVMVVVPAGKFLMGSPEGGSERATTEAPQHEVTFAKPFAVSKYVVTFDEWDACVAATACQRAADAWGRGNMPVINVSWDDAKAYARWLSRLTGKDYRLLTEAEWEYSARAGTTTRYSWGDDPGEGNANCDGCGSHRYRHQTAPVGSFKPNAFGLYDMHGNVWEWVEDVWHDDYAGAPKDGSAWLRGGDPSFRVARGGSYRNDTELIRAALRVKRNINVKFDTLGFRVARALTP